MSSNWKFVVGTEGQFNSVKLLLIFDDSSWVYSSSQCENYDRLLII